MTTIPWTVTDVLYSLASPCNMLSLGAMRGDGIVFDGIRDVMCDKILLQPLGKLNQKNNILLLMTTDFPNNTYQESLMLSSITKPKLADFETWHKRLGHVGANRIIEAYNAIDIKFDAEDVKTFDCESCRLGKVQLQNAYTIKPSPIRIGEFALDHMNLKPLGILGEKVALVMIEIRTNYVWVVPSKSKSIYQMPEEFLIWFETQSGIKPRVLWRDNAQEYISKDIERIMAKKGMKHRTNAFYTSSQNGKAERYVGIL